MRRLAGLLALLLVCGCRAPGRPPEGAVPKSPEQILDFGTLYRKNCQACHGVDGRGGMAVSLGNPVYVAYAGAAPIAAITAKGIGGSLMPAFARENGGYLTDQQIEILTDGIVRTWGNPAALGGATPPPYESHATGDAGAGEQLYRTDCLRCHAPGASSILDPAYLALISDGGLRTWMVVGAPQRGMPDWRGYAGHGPGGALGDQQLADLVAFLAKQRTAMPGQPYPNAAGRPGTEAPAAQEKGTP